MAMLTCSWEKNRSRQCVPYQWKQSVVITTNRLWWVSCFPPLVPQYLTTCIWTELYCSLYFKVWVANDDRAAYEFSVCGMACEYIRETWKQWLKARQVASVYPSFLSAHVLTSQQTWISKTVRCASLLMNIIYGFLRFGSCHLAKWLITFQDPC